MGLQMDPFLSGIRHGRQESGDSGTSLSSNNYSMPHTPDFLGNMDDSMDCISGMFVAQDHSIKAHQFWSLFISNFPKSQKVEQWNRSVPIWKLQTIYFHHCSRWAFNVLRIHFANFFGKYDFTRLNWFICSWAMVSIKIYLKMFTL